MTWIIAAVAILIFGLAALAATGKMGELPPPDDDTFAPTLPPGDLTADDLATVTFGVTLRGYDMAQVDALLKRLAKQLEAETLGKNLDAESENRDKSELIDETPSRSVIPGEGNEACERDAEPLSPADTVLNQRIVASNAE